MAYFVSVSFLINGFVSIVRHSIATSMSAFFDGATMFLPICLITGMLIKNNLSSITFLKKRKRLLRFLISFNWSLMCLFFWGVMYAIIDGCNWNVPVFGVTFVILGLLIFINILFCHRYYSSNSIIFNEDSPSKYPMKLGYIGAIILLFSVSVWVLTETYCDGIGRVFNGHVLHHILTPVGFTYFLLYGVMMKANDHGCVIYFGYYDRFDIFPYFCWEKIEN